MPSSIIKICCALLVLAACGTPETKNNLSTKIQIIPEPQYAAMLNSTFSMGQELAIYFDEQELSFASGYLKENIEKLTGFTVDTFYRKNDLTKKGVIVLSLDEEITHPEGYELSIAENITIKGHHPAGIFYGAQTLLQVLFQSKSSDFMLPAMEVRDSPLFSWRGMHLDVSRHFFEKDFIKKYIDILALHKMNTFHWHLVDDQGWRIEIKKYPRLTEIGAWRVDREELPWNERPPQKPGESASYGGFYTQEDIKEIVAYASQRHITVVPEIEMPAHVSSAIAAYPEFSCTGRQIAVPPGGVWPITDIYCAGKEETFTFLEDVLTEVMELFPSKFIHVGGDEADKTEWKTCAACQERIRKEGLKDEHELQSYFIRRMDRFLVENGRRLIGWDEILEGGLAENAAVMSWRGEQGGIAAAKMGHDVVMTPVSHCYFDYYQSLDRDIEPLAFGGFTDLEEVYSYQPVPEILSVEESKHVLGAQGNLWSEFLTSGDHVEYMALPRMTALAEVVWSSKEARNYQNFLERLQPFLDYLSHSDINYHIPAPVFATEMIFIDSLEIQMERKWPFGNIHYTLDGSEPSSKSDVFTGAVWVAENGVVKAIYSLENGKASPTKTGTFTKAVPMSPVKVEDHTLDSGLTFRYYEGAISSLRNFDKLKFKTGGKLEGVNLPDIPKNSPFGLEISGLMRIPETGVYTFTIVSDDGSQLFIGDKLVVDADGLHGPEPRSGQVALEAGFHPLKIRYFDAGGGQHLEGSIEGPGMTKRQLPADLLFHP